MRCRANCRSTDLLTAATPSESVPHSAAKLQLSSHACQTRNHGLVTLVVGSQRNEWFPRSALMESSRSTCITTAAAAIWEMQNKVWWRLKLHKQALKVSCKKKLNHKFCLSGAEVLNSVGFNSFIHALCRTYSWKFNHRAVFVPPSALSFSSSSSKNRNTSHFSRHR